MRDGWWVNYETRAYIGLHCPGLEHEMVLRDEHHQKWLGIPQSVALEFRKFKVGRDRVKILKFAMAQCSLMRIRGYGDARVSLQYKSPDSDPRPYKAISRWLARFGGEALLLKVTNFGTKKTVCVLGADWKDYVKKSKGGVK